MSTFVVGVQQTSSINEILEVKAVPDITPDVISEGIKGVVGVAYKCKAAGTVRVMAVLKVRQFVVHPSSV